MDTIKWLLVGDIVIQTLTRQYLLDETMDHQNGGLIQRYLECYDPERCMWGNSVYSKKWVSSTYTLLELKYMEIYPLHPTYQAATQIVLDELWQNKGYISKTKQQDMCMAAMVLSSVCYGQFKNEKIYEIVDYILEYQMGDGGWNCAYNSVHNQSCVGSFHSTISVLEALYDYESNGYTYRLNEVKKQTQQAQEYLLKRHLFKSLRTGDVVHPDMIQFHYPCRWKYDCFRALEYFCKIHYPYDSRMNDALTLVNESLKKGWINRGKKYPGKIHFSLETGQKGAFNTFRGLFILKHYDSLAFQRFISAYHCDEISEESSVRLHV